MNKALKSVLIVEDDLILSMVLVRMMKKLGFTTLEQCHTGKDAIQKVRSMQPELVLMDIQLKDDIDGITAMQTIRKRSDVPVIYITGNSDKKNLKRARKTAFIDYLVKPVQMNELEESLGKVFHSVS